MGPLPIGITADDLTGAADTAAALARPGRPVTVSLGPAPRRPVGGPAFAVTTNSRACPANEVYRLAAASVAGLRDAGAGLIYVKVDSNLRGHVGAALAAGRDVLGGLILFAPAFPARGRTTVDGVALVNRVPVAETEMAYDPEAPVTSSEVIELLRGPRADLEIALCDLSTVRAGAEAIRSALPDHGVLALDAETDSDLDSIAEAALALSPLPVMAGSAGLAAALARRLFGPPAHLDWPTTRAGPVLSVLASSSEVLTSQVAAAAGSGDVASVPFLCRDLTWEDQPVPELRRAIEAAGAGLTAGRHVVVYATGPLPAVARPVALVVEHLAHLAFVVVKEARPGGLLVGGGATAQAVLEALGAEAVEVDEEPLPGIAAGLIVGGELDGHPIALKPGAAGGEQAVVQLLDYLGRRAGAVEAGR